jgi:hypothetical protein
VEWQLAHPTGTKEEAEAWLIAEREAGRVVCQDADVANEGKGGKRAKGAEGAAKKAKR